MSGRLRRSFCVLLSTALLGAALGASVSREWRVPAPSTARQPQSPCQLEPERGLCYAAFSLHYFDAATGTCEEFLYGGCGGNANRFASLAECLDTCAPGGSAAGGKRTAYNATPASYADDGRPHPAAPPPPAATRPQASTTKTASQSATINRRRRPSRPAAAPGWQGSSAFFRR
ncbi:uncharacterized protein LOC144137707 [Haemaphysalis longicornis]